MNDALLGKGIHAGHMLATYTLSQFFTPAPEAPEGQVSRGSGDDSTHTKVETSLEESEELELDKQPSLRKVLTEAIESTRCAHPEAGQC